jgi:hypothetical protein
MRNQIKHFWLICFSLFSLSLFSQDITQMRIYFDGNENAAQYFTIGNLSAVDQPFTADVSALARGVHTLYIQVKDSDGRWSLYDMDNIQIIGGVQMAQLNAFEYFYDADPGFGEGTQVAISTESVDQDFDLSFDGLANGTHTLYMRVKDNENQWSLYDAKLIQIVGSQLATITEMEYYFNTDPGFGNGQSVNLNALLIDQDLQLSLTGLAKGVHTLYIRVKDNTGQWSLYDQQNIQIQGGVGYENLVYAEYYIDTDPGVGNATEFFIPEQNIVNDNFDLPIPTGLTGAHTICVRVMDGAGQWSETACQNFTICSINIPTIISNGTPCSSSPQTLTVPAGYTAYSWSTGGQSNQITVNQSGTYSVTVYDSDCSTTVDIDVTIGNISEPNIVQSGGICIGDVMTLQVPDLYDSYSWTTGSETASTNVTTEGTYYLTITQGDCEVTTSYFADFYAAPTPTISTIGSSCIGDIQTVSIDNIFENILWSTLEESNSISVASSGTYTVQATLMGCPTSNQIEIFFNEVPTPQITVTGDNCQGGIQTLDLGNNYTSILWTTDESTPSIDVTSSGEYSVTVANGTCTANTSAQVDFIAITTPTITVNTNTMFCDQTGVSYQWYLNGQPILNANGQFYTATQSGFYSVEIQTQGCTAESAILNFIYQNVIDLKSNLISVYPNPTSEHFSIRSSLNGICHIQIFDSKGGLVYSTSASSELVEINTSEFANGLYQLIIKNNNQVYRNKIEIIK